MSLTAPPDQHQPARVPSASTPRNWLVRERHHWAAMSRWSRILLLGVSALLLYLAPLLPLIAYLLWQWASSSWAWRDRWTSMWIWAKQGAALVALVLALALLGNAQVGIISWLLVPLQALWHTHMGGDLSLSPMDLNGLLARTLLLLPLAPALALLYEWLDPHTTVQLERILTPADLAEPKPRPTPPTQASPAASMKPGTSRAGAAARERTRRATKATTLRRSSATPPQSAAPAEQITIESFLASETRTTTPSSPSLAIPPEPSVPEAQASGINWDEVAE